MNIHDWKVKYNGQDVAQILRFTPNITSTKVLTKALDGTVYIQTIGTGLKHAAIELLCTLEQIDIINAGESEGGVFTATYRGKTRVGYIEEQPEWEAVVPGEWYKTTITFLIEEEVEV